ncbi:MAG: hypothetical protein COA57_07505 [Flavobacteriales bacterium]|nr:MAG: hypothetical protein COA57_07505 [Flavobacteriales bacterium]
MKKHLVISGFIVLITLCSLVPGSRKTAGAPAERTGAPIFSAAKEGTCASGGCHNTFSVNSGNGILTIELLNGNQYVAGAENTFRVTISETGFDKFGFEALILRNDSNLNVGEIKLTDAINTQVIGASSQTFYLKNRKYITHTYDGTTPTSANTAQWEFKWLAPENYTDSVTIYASAVSANFDLESTNDYVYTASLPLGGTMVSVDEFNIYDPQFTVFPNPFKDNLFIKTDLSHDMLLFELYDLNGKLVVKKEFSGKEITLEKSMKNGSYLYKISSGEKVLKQGKIVKI